MAIIDLRPKKGSILERFLSLGLVYDHEETDADGDKVQVWFDYQKQLKGEFKTENAETVTFTDIPTRIQKTVTTTELASVSRIITWKSSLAPSGSIMTDSTDSSGSTDSSTESH